MQISDERAKRLGELLDAAYDWLPYLQDIINEHTTGLAPEDNRAIRDVCKRISVEIEGDDGTLILKKETDD